MQKTKRSAIYVQLLFRLCINDYFAGMGGEWAEMPSSAMPVLMTILRRGPRASLPATESFCRSF